MNIEITKPSGIKLKTGSKVCQDDITVTPKLQEKTATQNGECTPDAGYAGISKVVVNVPNEIPDGYIKPSGTRSIAENGVYDVEDYEKVEVNVPETIPDGYVRPSGIVNIYANGLHEVGGYQYAQIEVPTEEGAADPVLQDKFVFATENGTVDITPDSGFDGLSKATVLVNVPIPDGYIQPSGTLTVTENGTHDAKAYASVVVAVPLPPVYDGSFTEGEL